MPHARPHTRKKARDGLAAIGAWQPQAVGRHLDPARRGFALRRAIGGAGRGVYAIVAGVS